MNENKTFKVKDKNGNIVTLNIILTFDDNDTNNSYVLYTDNTYSDNGKLNVFASRYDSRLDNPILDSNLSDSEWKVIETIIDSIDEQIEMLRSFEYVDEDKIYSLKNDKKLILKQFKKDYKAFKKKI